MACLKSRMERVTGDRESVSKGVRKVLAALGYEVVLLVYAKLGVEDGFLCPPNMLI